MQAVQSANPQEKDQHVDLALVECFTTGKNDSAATAATKNRGTSGSARSQRSVRRTETNSKNRLISRHKKNAVCGANGEGDISNAKNGG